WIDPPRPECSSVRLLPRFDTYLLGYTNRKLVVPPEQEKRIHPGGGILHPVLLVDGAARGVWSLKTRQARVEVLIEPFADLPGAVRQGLEAEVASIGHFFRLEPEWVLAGPDQVS
ncbi:MAG TPA: crosslink repair DNA glycosylase YcaQ family protein, partial [Anaerolineales bacterium]